MLEAEGDRQYYSNGDGTSSDLADAPLGHRTDDADGLTVQTLVASTANHPHIAHFTIGTHNETAQNAALNAVLVSIVRIFARLVDEVDETSLATRELWLNVNIVKLIDFNVGLLGSGVDGCDMSHLCYHR